MSDLPAEAVGRVWNWLPAFRAVAETEHLPTAARRLYVTPSALSRTIGLLEQELGRPVFRRVGRRIRLNEAGQRLLVRVRDAMRLVHHGVQEAREETLAGPLRIYASGILTPIHVEPSIERMRVDHPRLVAYLRSSVSHGVEQDLLRGLIDLAFMSEPVRSEGVRTEFLGTASNGVYCGPGHPLFRKRKISVEQVLEYEFAAPVPDASGRKTDGWPDNRTRLVGLHAEHMAVGIRACESGRLLAVLPDAIGERQGLKRVPMDPLPDVKMYAIHRPFLAEGERAELFLEYVRAHIAEATASDRRPRAHRTAR